jgi:outer membrane biosynthesis protein TonB
MAQAKTKTKAKPKSKPSPRRASSSKKTQARPRSSSNEKAKDKAAALISNSADKATTATTAVGHAADKAKIPLVAGGAALAGAAGGMALGVRQARRHSRIERAVKLAGEFQRARGSANGGKQHRSPLEVVLEGLTARRSRA